eukprot:CAMPEP_0174264440 /NCGR_PEP_ID=MMETSP0439-20130205/22468_1 /TAXON_ID=0 /ORGANISM="Stereomyxa ramosa, Strain Chinc5" /LENGTH=247 /DNA_ID=CAMNT_0015350309 /DNA_START=216 /DNA_END=959 /DNA_ORIENTATION=+
MTNHLRYKLVMEVRGSDGQADKQKKVEFAIWANPSKVRMDEKDDQVEETYPHMFFAVNNFHDDLHHLTVEETGELVCVQLFASGKIDYMHAEQNNKTIYDDKDVEDVVIFSGAVRYDVIKKHFKLEMIRKSGGWKKYWANLRATKEKSEIPSIFLNMKGPNGKGKAQMVVRPHENCILEKIENMKNGEQSIWKAGMGSMKKLWLSSGEDADEEEPSQYSCCITSLLIDQDSIIKDIIHSYHTSSKAS